MKYLILITVFCLMPVNVFAQQSEVLINLNNITHCDELFDQNKKNSCIKKVAIATNDPSLCERTDLFTRIICYKDIAIKRDELSVCDMSTHEGVKYQCYAIYAEFKQDIDICSKIPTDDEES
jgi:hypothetical protein